MPHRTRRFARSSAAVLVILGVALGGALTAPSVASADGDTQDDTAYVVAGPTHDLKKFDNRTSYLFTIGPGQSVQDGLLVRNDGTVPQEVTVFPTNVFNADDGGYAVLPTDEPPTDVGS